ncbi:hypothetical protein F4778DRAFT_516590 [Xylariomycetidae sp. FL2044]|nr:hypothetical protein F4778DRAFT_516590 [Xylariomycetidae sp. FL2044]
MYLPRLPTYKATMGFRLDIRRHGPSTHQSSVYTRFSSLSSRSILSAPFPAWLYNSFPFPCWPSFLCLFVTLIFFAATFHLVLSSFPLSAHQSLACSPLFRVGHLRHAKPQPGKQRTYTSTTLSSLSSLLSPIPTRASSHLPDPFNSRHRCCGQHVPPVS